MERRCKACRFWVQGLDDFGDCRRHPPRVVSGVTTTSIDDEDDLDERWQDRVISATVFPITFDEHWCGEWRSKDTAVEDAVLNIYKTYLDHLDYWPGRSKTVPPDGLNTSMVDIREEIDRLNAETTDDAKEKP